MEKVDIAVIQRPIKVEFDCPHCKEEIIFDYTDFESIAGEPCDWKHTKIFCPKCGKQMEIDYVDWC